MGGAMDGAARRFMCPDRCATLTLSCLRLPTTRKRSAQPVYPADHPSTQRKRLGGAASSCPSTPLAHVRRDSRLSEAVTMICRLLTLTLNETLYDATGNQADG